MQVLSIRHGHHRKILVTHNYKDHHTYTHDQVRHNKTYPNFQAILGPKSSNQRSFCFNLYHSNHLTSPRGRRLTSWEKRFPFLDIHHIRVVGGGFRTTQGLGNQKWSDGDLVFANMKIIGKSTVLKMDVKKMQNSHLEFNTSSCLWKGVGLLPYLNHQYDFIPETSRPVYTGKTHHHHFSPTPFHYWHMHFMSSSPQVPGPTWSFLLNLLLGSIFNGISFQRSYRIQKTQRPIQHFDVWKCPNSLLIYIRNCFWWRCSRRSWANAASEVDASQNGILSNGPFWHLKTGEAYKPYQYP